jgi:hypothetical protein
MSPGVRAVWEEIKRGRERGDREPHPDPHPDAEAAARGARLDQIEQGLAQIGERLDAIAANTAPQPERRSQMSPARKSEVIRSKGIEHYRSIPW